MKFETNTVSKPVVGKGAKELIKAIKSGGHVASPAALEMMQRIAARHNKVLVVNGNKK